MFGVSTFCLHDRSLESALDQISAISDFIEVMDEGFHYLKSAEPLQSYSVKFSVHSPCRGTNIASLLEQIRRASVEVMGECFTIAAEVNAGVVVHPGYFAWVEEREKAENQCKKSISELTHLSAEHGVPFYIENMGDWEYFLLKTPGELPLIGNARFALDVGHAHQNHCLEEFLSVTAQHFHLHDNDGKSDTHATVGDGTIDFGPVMKIVKKSGIRPVIEVATYDGVLKSIERLKAF
ncbi:MAG: sugar phosphate isomerase/epimerase [Methanoregula sp.]|nr:MAG: sugar phosphate isomerase/epimerase [Methanoregula sp.]